MYDVANDRESMDIYINVGLYEIMYDRNFSET